MGVVLFSFVLLYGMVRFIENGKTKLLSFLPFPAPSACFFTKVATEHAPSPSQILVRSNPPSHQTDPPPNPIHGQKRKISSEIISTTKRKKKETIFVLSCFVVLVKMKIFVVFTVRHGAVWYCRINSCVFSSLLLLAHCLPYLPRRCC